MAKKKKLDDLRDGSVQSMQDALLKLDQEIFALRNELAWNRKMEKPHRLKQARKEKARVLTFLTMKQRAV